MRNEETYEWTRIVQLKLDMFNQVPINRYKTKLQKLRSVFLFLNKTMYKVYNFDKFKMKLFRTIESHAKKNSINSLYLELTERKHPECNEKYIHLVINTLKKYENPCIKILVILNRLFCSDIARYITEFL